MRGPKPEPLSLSEAESKALEMFVRRHSTPQQLAMRGRMILLANEGKNNGQIARELGVSVDTVRTWRMRWIGLQAASLEELPIKDRLADVPRPGRPSQITAEQTCQMIAMACEQPKERQISHGKGRDMAEEVRRGGIIEQFPPQQAALLQKGGPKSPISPVFGSPRQSMS